MNLRTLKDNDKGVSRTMKRSVKTRAITALALSALTALTLSACAGDATPDNGNGAPSGEEQLNLQFNSYLGPNTPQAKAISWLWDELEARTDGRIKVDQFFEGGLLAGPDTLAGVAQGRVDIGFMTVLYNPAELPLSQVVAIPFQTSNVEASHLAFNELAQTNEQYKEEWAKTGVELIYMIGTPSSVVGGKEPIEDLSWFEGKGIRSSGYIASAIQEVGGNPIALASPEIYEGMQRGTLDGYANNIIDTAIVSQSLHEVAPWIAETGLGLYTVNALIINPDVWNQFTDAEKAIFDELEDEYAQKNAEFLIEVDDQGCQLLIGEGGGATAWPQSEIDTWKNIVGDSALEQWQTDVTNSGQDYEQFYEAYTSVLAKYDTGDFQNGIQRCAETTAAQ